MLRQDISSHWPPALVLNQPVAFEEDAITEFKEVTSQKPASVIIDTVEEYAVAFLNGKGGRILWGIRDTDRCVVGVSLDALSRDRIRKDIAGKFHNIQPAVDPTRYRLEFHSVGGNSIQADLFVVELSIENVPTPHPFYDHRGDLIVRINGVNQKLKGPQLTAWIQRRVQAETHSTGAIDDPKLYAQVQRIRQVFDGHGLEPAHLARFLHVRKASFSITFSDIHSDAALLHWLDESKINWIATTFLLRREWIDGEDSRIHEVFCYDKRPQIFLATASQHADVLISDEVHALPEAYFLRWGVGKEWQRKGEGRVFVVLAIPLARFSNERTIYKYISDFQPYPWADERTNIQLRAWARLLAVNKSIQCFGQKIPYAVGEQLYADSIFLREVIEKHSTPTSDHWHPQDHAFYAEEIVNAKDTDTFPRVIEFLRSHNLPWEKTR